MMACREFALSELHRRVSNLIRCGVISKINYDKARVRVTLGTITTDWLPWLTAQAGDHRDWQPPALGEQVVLLSPQGDYSQGIVLHGLYQTKFPAPANTPDAVCYQSADGSHFSHDHQTHTLTVNVMREGKLVLQTGNAQLILKNGQITLSADDNITLRAPRITLNGQVEGV